jgi:hypothetical protein
MDVYLEIGLVGTPRCLMSLAKYVRWSPKSSAAFV